MAKDATSEIKALLEKALTEGYLVKFQYPAGGEGKMTDRHFLPQRLWVSKEGNLSIKGWEYTEYVRYRTKVMNGQEVHVPIGTEVRGWHTYSLDKIAGLRLAAKVDPQEAWQRTYQKYGIFRHCFKEGAERLVVFPTPALKNDHMNRRPYIIDPEQLEERLAAGWTVTPTAEPGKTPVFVRQQ